MMVYPIPFGVRCFAIFDTKGKCRGMYLTRELAEAEMPNHEMGWKIEFGEKEKGTGNFIHADLFKRK